MTFAQKKTAALACLAATNIARNNYAPLLYRLLWSLGLQIAPPHFNGFITNLFVSGTVFATAFGAIMTAQAVFLTHQIIPDMQGITLYFATVGPPAGLAFGLLMATYYAFGAHKHKLPKWRDLQTSTGWE